MIQYCVCRKPFALCMVDEDGAILNNKYKSIKKGEVFTVLKDKNKFTAADDAIRLENENGWIEIQPVTFRTYFEVDDGQ